MWQTVVGLFLLTSPLVDNMDWQIDVQEIDEEVSQLQDRRIKVLGKANLLEDKAIRWQFLPDQFNETRRAYEQADAYRQEAKAIDTQIDLLERRKQRILQQHGLL